jgi:hypothetical protein
MRGEKKAPPVNSGQELCITAKLIVKWQTWVQEPFTGQKPFSKRPDPPRARDGAGLVICPGWSAGADDQLTNARACRRFVPKMCRE